MLLFIKIKFKFKEKQNALHPTDIVAKAREMDLLTYLQNYEPQELVHFGGNTYS